MHKNINRLCFNDLVSKRFIIYAIVMVLDIGFIIYCARRNIINYVTIEDREVIIGGNNRLYFGRNYITVVITLFFYVYICLLNKFIFRKDVNERFYVLWFVILTIVNVMLFMLFSKKIY